MKQNLVCPFSTISKTQCRNISQCDWKALQIYNIRYLDHIFGVFIAKQALVMYYLEFGHYRTSQFSVAHN